MDKSLCSTLFRVADLMDAFLSTGCLPVPIVVEALQVSRIEINRSEERRVGKECVP